MNGLLCISLEGILGLHLFVLSAKYHTNYRNVRYKKLSRDVPQSLWMITAASSEQKEDEEEGKAQISDHSVDNNQLAQSSKPTHQRKGRNSVEEIVSFAVKKVSGCSECHLHACGREDIDVRCLGNEITDTYSLIHMHTYKHT